jgi:hypothetical protein
MSSPKQSITKDDNEETIPTGQSTIPQQQPNPAGGMGRRPSTLSVPFGPGRYDHHLDALEVPAKIPGGSSTSNSTDKSLASNLNSASSGKSFQSPVHDSVETKPPQHGDNDSYNTDVSQGK